MDQPDKDKTPGPVAQVVVDEVRVRGPRRRKNHWGDDALPVEMTQVPQAPAAPAPRWPGYMAVGAVLFGLAGLGSSYWVHAQGQAEILRLSTELAQLRVSLELYARNGADTAGLNDLGERLTALEQDALSDVVPMPATFSVEAETTVIPPPAEKDCLPEGMRLLVAAGDSYPVCGQPAEVAVSVVDNGYITLADGTSVASGGTTPLPGLPTCTLAVTSGGDEGVTGYAEIRVSC